MKAAAYIEEYNKFRAAGDTPSAACGGLVILLNQEIPQLCQARRAKRPEAVFAVLKEVEQKWKAILRRLPDEDRLHIREDGFARCVRKRLSTGLCAMLNMHGVLKVNHEEETTP